MKTTIDHRKDTVTLRSFVRCSYEDRRQMVTTVFSGVRVSGEELVARWEQHETECAKVIHFMDRQWILDNGLKQKPVDLILTELRTYVTSTPSRGRGVVIRVRGQNLPFKVESAHDARKVCGALHVTVSDLYSTPVLFHLCTQVVFEHLIDRVIGIEKLFK